MKYSLKKSLTSNKRTTKRKSPNKRTTKRKSYNKRTTKRKSPNKRTTKRKSPNKRNTTGKIKIYPLNPSSKSFMRKRYISGGTNGNISILVSDMDSPVTETQIEIDPTQNIKDELNLKYPLEDPSLYIAALYFNNERINITETFKEAVPDFDENARFTIDIRNYYIELRVRDTRRNDGDTQIKIDKRDAIRPTLRKLYLDDRRDVTSIRLNSIEATPVNINNTFIKEMNDIRDNDILYVETDPIMVHGDPEPHHWECDLFDGGDQCTCP